MSSFESWNQVYDYIKCILKERFPKIKNIQIAPVSKNDPFFINVTKLNQFNDIDVTPIIHCIIVNAESKVITDKPAAAMYTFNNDRNKNYIKHDVVDKFSTILLQQYTDKLILK